MKTRMDSVEEAAQRRHKALALGMFEERNQEGDDEMVIGESGPLPLNAKWPFPKAPSSAQRPLFDEGADE